MAGRHRSPEPPNRGLYWVWAILLLVMVIGFWWTLIWSGWLSALLYTGGSVLLGLALYWTRSDQAARRER